MLTVLQGDCRDLLRTLSDESVHCCVTSPPYFGLRDYGTDGQIGLEPTLDQYVAQLVGVFREVRRVLRTDGTCWLNLGDSYNGSGAKDTQINSPKQMTNRGGTSQRGTSVTGLKPKDLCGVPWRVAFALQADGWYLRSDIIWSKPNPMPESVTDRPTKAHEYLFLLAKSERYFYDAEAIKEEAARPEGSGNIHPYEVPGQRKGENANLGGGLHRIGPRESRNKRSVWTINSQPYPDSHFATFPEALVEPCILAGCPTGGTVLDPFAGSGTVGRVALSKGRQAVLIELNPEYCKLIDRRCEITYGLQFEMA